MRQVPRLLSDAALPGVIGVVGVVELVGLQPSRWEYGVALELVACSLLLLRRRFPLWAPAAAGFSSLMLPWIDPGLDEAATPVMILIVAIYSLARLNTMSRTLVGLGVFVIGFLSYYLLLDTDPHDITDPVFVVALTAPPYFLGRLTRKLAEQAEQLERQQTLIRSEAVLAERQRIARELHDVIAHSVSAMVVQTAAAQDLLLSEPDRAAALLENVTETGRRALAETGRLLHVIRDDEDELGLSPAPGLGRLSELVEQFRTSGLTVDLTIDEPLPVLAPGIDVSAYRIVQEALTNALKYAPDGHVSLYVGGVDGALSIRATNWSDGRAGSGSGLGLQGMKERVRLIGGQLVHGTNGDGRFELEATVPGGGSA